MDPIGKRISETKTVRDLIRTRVKGKLHFICPTCSKHLKNNNNKR